MSIANFEQEAQNAVMSPGTGAAPNITGIILHRHFDVIAPILTPAKDSVVKD